MAQSQVYVFMVRWTIGDRTDTWRESFLEWLKQVETVKSVYQLEKGDISERLHVQAYVKLKTKVRPKQLAIASNDILPGVCIQACSAAGKMALEKYCMKKDTRVEGPFGYPDAPYMGEDLYQVPRPWQKYLEERILEEPDDRSIIWIYDHKGNSGKSKFTKKMAFYHGASFLSFARAENLLALACKKISKCYIFDLTRTKPVDIAGGEIYAAMEQIKNGMVCQTKFQVEAIFFKPPHVIVFSNSLPRYELLTQDRWITMTIDENSELVHYVPPQQ